MTPRHFARRLRRAGRLHHRGGWAPAFLAARSRRDGVPAWALKIGQHPDIARSAKTVMHWSRAVEVALTFVPVIGRRAAFAYNVSVWLAIAPYAATVERALLADLLAAFTAEQCSIEQLEAQLREAFGDGEDFVILDELDRLMARCVRVAERLSVTEAVKGKVERALEWLRQARLEAEGEGL